jgi:guanylate kinase
MTPRGVNNIRSEDRANCFVIFIDPDKETIRKRLTERKDADSADRRMEADDKDFFEFFNYDMRVTNHDF